MNIYNINEYIAAIKFFRSCVAQHDIFYYNDIISNDYFAPIMELWREHKDRDNLINSSILELFEFIRRENIKKLIEYIIQKYRKDLEDSQHFETFKLMLSTYDTEKQREELKRPPPEDSTIKAFENKKEEDAYFSEITEDEYKEEGDDAELEEKMKFLDKLKPIKSEEEEDGFDLLTKVDKEPQEAKIQINIEGGGELNGKKRMSNLNHDEESPPKKRKTVANDLSEH